MLRPDNLLVATTRLPPESFGFESGYFFDSEKVAFVLDPMAYPWLGHDEPTVFVAGDFNDWRPFDRDGKWRLRAKRIGARRVLAASFPISPDFVEARSQFKFVTEDRRWLQPPDNAPNLVRNAQWNTNLAIDPTRTGHHRFLVTTADPLDLSADNRLVWKGPDGVEEEAHVWPGDFFFQQRSHLPLGAIIERGRTIFRLFAPRATSVEVYCFRRLQPPREELRLFLRRAADGCWETVENRNLDGWYYWYFIDGPPGPSTWFRPGFPLVDPYAKALVESAGPGIIIDGRRLPTPRASFRPPPREDLVVLEIHARDAIARTPLDLTPEERLGFTGMAKWVRRKGGYLESLGVNAVELQPIQEFDNSDRDEYHWGYMPVNFFAPESSYALDPARGTQIEEFADLVRAFHERGLAVILDVVYNHVGIPNFLLFIDKHYYFELDAEGELANWSGCGNDLRCGAAMARRLIIDSLLALARVYDVDGFRFDLAELIGVDTLAEIERELTAAKPGIILIAEPWSFRGHIGKQLRDTRFSSWNDGFRDFIAGMMRGRGDQEGVRYFLAGSPGTLATFPAQTVNYIESHDDRSWIDRITENPGNNGYEPTPRDRLRTHLACAFLMASLGIPMLSAGQDFLRSKHGVTNTYKRGDLNALDYSRLERFRDTHDYFARWIRFRLSKRGRLLRLSETPTNTYFSFTFAGGDGSAFAVVYNADGSLGPMRLLLAMNSGENARRLDLGDAGEWRWLKLADEEVFFAKPRRDSPPGRGLDLPPFSLGLWFKDEERALA